MAGNRTNRKRTGSRSSRPGRPGELPPPTPQQQETFRRLVARFEQAFPGFIGSVTNGPCSHCMGSILDAWEESRATGCRFRPAGTLDADYQPIFTCVVRNDKGRYLYRPPRTAVNS